MNKTKMILAAVGGTIGVAVIAAAVFVYLQLSAKSAVKDGSEDEPGLIDTLEKVDTLQKAAIKPHKKSLEVIQDSIKAMKDEHAKLLEYAQSGDTRIAEMSPQQFRETAGKADAYLKMLPVDSEEKMVAADFEFVPLMPYISGDKLPEPAEMKKLCRFVEDERTLIEMCAAAGVARVSRMDTKTLVSEEPKEDPKAKKGGKKAKKPAQKKGREPFKPSSQTYELVTQMKPSALVKILNTMATSKRFLVVEDFSIQSVTNPIPVSFSNERKDAEEASTTSRRRRRQVVEEEKPAEGDAEAPKVTLVTDPERDSLFNVTLVVTVHDFKSCEDESKEEAK